MTTPAINLEIDRKLNVGETYLIYDDGNGNQVKAGTQATARRSSYYKHVRPASVSTAPVRGIPRDPTNWSHSSSFENDSPGLIYFITPRTRPPGQLDWVGRYWTEGSYWDDIPIFVPPSIPLWMQSRAEMIALNSILHQDLHLGNFLAEIRQTQDMFVSNVTAITKSVSGFRSSPGGKRLWKAITSTQVGGSAADFRKIPDAWLEIQYGWKPLMSDVFGACNALNSSKRQPIISVVGRSKRDSVAQVSRSGASSGSIQVKELDLKETVNVKLYYRLNNGFLAELASLGLINPLEIIWEVTRYSFVVDWFLPVSSWLQSLTASVGWSFISGYHNTKSEWRSRGGVIKEVVIPPDGKSTGSIWSTTNQGGDFFLHGSAFTRTKYLSSPVPGIYLKNPLSSGHVANAMSLLVQAFR